MNTEIGSLEMTREERLEELETMLRLVEQAAAEMQEYGYRIRDLKINSTKRGLKFPAQASREENDK